MMFVTFTLLNSHQVTINLAQIESIRETPKGSLIRTCGGHSHEVTTTHAEVLATLAALVS